MRKSFIFYASWLEAIESLPESVQSDALRAVVEYGIKGEISEQIKPISRAILNMAKGNIDANYKRYLNGCKGGSKDGVSNNPNGRRGKQELPKNYQETTKELPKNYQETTKELPNDNVNDNVNDNNIYAFNKLNALSSENSENDATDAANAEISPKIEQKIDERKQADAVIDYFNEEIIKQKGRLRACRARTDRRMQSVMARVREYGPEVVQDVILKAVKSRFLNYEATNAPVDLEWIMRPNNFPKVLEGKYDDRPPKAGETGVILRPNPERYKNQKLW